MIEITCDSEIVAVGEKISGNCLWTPSSQNDPKPMKLEVGWRTEGRGDVDKEIIYEAAIEPFIPSHFNCLIPIAGPVSYNGQLLRIIWEITVSRSKWFGLQKDQEIQAFRVIPREL